MLRLSSKHRKSGGMGLNLRAADSAKAFGSDAPELSFDCLAAQASGNPGV